MYGNNSHKKKVFFQAMLKRKRVKIWILFHINHFLHLVKFHLLQHFVFLTATKPLPSASSRPSWGCAPSSPSPGSKTSIRRTEMKWRWWRSLCVLQANSLFMWNLESIPVWSQDRGFLRNCLQKQEKEGEVIELPSWTDVHVSYLFSWIWMTADYSINLYYRSVNDVLIQLSIL